MCKRWSSCLGFIITIFFAILFALFILNDKSLFFDNFPLQQRWVADLKGEVEAISTNGDQIVFVRTKRILYALAIHSGKILWKHELSWQAIPQPVVALNGIVFLADGKVIWALDERNGTVLWQQPIPVREVDVKSVSERFVAVDVAQNVSIYDAKTGVLLWSKAVCRNEIQAYIENDYIYIPCYGIRAMEVSSGNDVWEIKEPSRIARVNYQDGVMYYSPEVESVSAFDLNTQKVLWTSSFSGAGFRQFTILGEYLGITNSDQFCTFKRDTGDRAWCLEINNPQNPTIVGDTLFIFNGYQNKIVAFDLSGGQRIGELIIRKMRLFIVHRALMVSTKDILVFGSGNEVFGFGK